MTARPRFSLVDYAGPTSCIKLDQALRLDPSRFAFMPKEDGSYVDFSTDPAGRIFRMTFRTGREVDGEEADGLYGVAIGLPSAQLVGELDIYSEAAVRLRKTRGWAALSVFDIIRCGGRYVAREPFQVRRALLERWQSDAIPDDWFWQDGTGRAHDRKSNRFVKPTPRNRRRVPLIPLATGKAGLEQLWHSYVEVGGGEGIVAVDLNAPVGAKRAKLKCRRVETMDAVVVAIRGRAVRCLWAGETFLVQAKRLVESGGVKVGDVVELKANGVHEFRSIPKHPRILRARHDLRGDNVKDCASSV